MMTRSQGWRWWILRLVDRDHRVSTVFDLAGIIGGILTISEVWRSFSAWSSSEPLKQLNLYLWVTFGATLFLVAFVLVLDRAIRRELRHAKEDTSIREKCIQVQHQMAEEVRKCAELRDRFDCDEHLQRVAHGLQEMLRRRLGGAQYSVTIKSTELHTGKLVTVFRDSAQEQIRRDLGDVVDLVDSVAYQRFVRETSNPRKWVLIKDTERLPGSDSKYAERARRCGYRSVLAFPLRLPRALGAKGEDPDILKCASLFGFLSLDSPQADAFAGLFHPPPKGAQVRDDGEDLAPCDDQEFFYGLADAVATILVLQRGRSNGAQHHAEGGHHDGGGDQDHEGERGRVPARPEGSS